ncbi:MAG TPA: tetratricopeptide repeat protein [Verrucomicrobiae bacterium]|nr:tetratricopeptide repeat protein [Verrucomicrobiae bacterium]
MSLTVRERRFLAGGVIVLITLLAYWPAVHGGFIWDDDAHVTDSQALRTLHGLATIWTRPGAVMQYYPLVHTSFWLEYHLWQLNPFGYHLVNVLLQAGNAILLWLVLEQLEIGGAWLAAAVFAIHPVHVESVAWISERKNVLCGTFYLSSVWSYLRFRLPCAKQPTESGYARWYWLALVFFVAALLSKTVACTLPMTIVLTIWWKQGSITKRDVWLLVPFVVAGIALGLVTVWVETYHTGARGVDWSFTLFDRMLIAGRALWFYAAKLVWPTNLTFIYPRWNIDVSQWGQWMFPLGAVLVAALLWAMRTRIGRGPIMAAAFFGITLAPALGFINIYPMRYSFVADHFQYLASIGLIVAAVAAFGVVIRDPRLRRIAATVALACLATLTWLQGRTYQNPETLWRDTLAKNPGCWMAHNNLGILLAHRNDIAGARAEYHEALRINPSSYETYANLGNLFMQQSRAADAVSEYWKALRTEPGYTLGRYDLAVALSHLGRTDEAITQYRIVVEMKPDEVDAHYNLGLALAKRGRLDEACRQFAEVVRYAPGSVNAEYNWGFALAKQGDLAGAISHYQAALDLNPEYAAAHYARGMALLQSGRRSEGIRELRRTLELEPGSTAARRALDAANARA